MTADANPGAHRDRNKWRAKIKRSGVETYLRTYDDKFTAAIVFQVADQEYNKLGLTSQRGANRKPKTCTNHQPAETFLLRPGWFWASFWLFLTVAGRGRLNGHHQVSAVSKVL